MMIRKVKPIDELDRWSRGLDRLLNPMFRYESLSAPSPWRPPTDVYETSDAVVIKMEIAGMTPDDFDISFANRILEIRGTRTDKQRKLSYHCLEIQYGEFLSQVYLPGSYAVDKIQAHYDNGFLTITLPKSVAEPRSIEVHADGD